MDYLERDKYFINRISYRMNLKKKKSDLWNARCPICGDSATNKSKKRFFIYIKNKKMKTVCHNCDWFGSMQDLIKTEFSDLLQEYKFWGFTPHKKSLANQAKDILKEIPESKKEIPLFVEDPLLFKLTTHINELSDKHPAKKYILTRQIPFDKVYYTQNFYNLTKELYQEETYKHCAIPAMIIPFFKANGRIEIIQGRFFDPKVKPKYLTVKFNPDAPKIYNEDFVDEKRRVWILEGPVDSMFVYNSVSLAGSDGNPNYKDQVWCYDNEPSNYQINKKIKNKITQGEKVVIWRKSDNYKDINEGIVKGMISKKDVVSILQNRTFSGLKARLEFTKFKK